MKRTYIKRAMWHLSDRKKQKGGFLHILGALSRPLLVSVAGTIDGEVLKGLGTIIGGRRRKRKRRSKRLQKVKSFNCS